MVSDVERDREQSITRAEALEKRTQPRALTEFDAVDIWIARWLRVRQKDLLARYSCDSRRLYEIWWGERFPASRRKAADVFRERYPDRTDRTDFGYRRIPRVADDPAQIDLFDESAPVFHRPLGQKER